MQEQSNPLQAALSNGAKKMRMSAFNPTTNPFQMEFNREISKENNIAEMAKVEGDIETFLDMQAQIHQRIQGLILSESEDKEAANAPYLVMMAIGNVLMNEHRWLSAAHVFEHGERYYAENDNEIKRMRINRGFCFFRLDNLNEALNLFLSAYELSPSEDTLFNIAVCLEKMGDIGQLKILFSQLPAICAQGGVMSHLLKNDADADAFRKYDFFEAIEAYFA